MDTRELGVLLRKRELSAVELVQATLDRIERVESKLNAYITVAGEAALEEARRRDAELADGKDRGRLHGIPLAAKDLYDTAGIRTTSGSKILAGRVPAEDATTIANLRAAGAVLIGKTNLNEFACGVTTTNAHYGNTNNPWDLVRSPGGSSGGSGAAVAAGLCTVATGTDTGGSIRIPAALCGIVGLKPSYGRASCRGIMPLSWEQDHPGPMTRTVYDAAVMMGIMAGWDESDPATVRWPVPDYTADLADGIDGWRIGVDRDYTFHGISSPVRAAFEKALDVLHALGAEIVDVRVPRLEDGMAGGVTIWNAEAAAVHAEWLRSRPEDYDPLVRTRLEAAFGVTGVDYARAQRVRRELVRDLELLFDGLDVFASPMCGVGAPPQGAKTMVVDGEEIDVLSGVTRFSRVFNLSGSPAISVPCGFTEDGLPIGLQLVGGFMNEATVLRAAYAYEQATDWHKVRPPEVN